MATATRLPFAFGDARAAYRWIDEHPQAAVKVALAY
jgi:hypothetical protein